MTDVSEYANRAKAWWGDARANPLFWKGAAAALVVAGLDQLTKYWIVHQVKLPEKRQIEISGIFDLTYVQNYGASFGMLSGARWVLTALSVIVAAALLTWLGGLKRWVAATGVAFVVGGALGNLYDRIAYGYVVDFLDFSGLYFPWVFNVADAAINVGIAFILLDAYLTREQKPKG